MGEEVKEKGREIVLKPTVSLPTAGFFAAGLSWGKRFKSDERLMIIHWAGLHFLLAEKCNIHSCELWKSWNLHPRIE